MHDTHFTCEQAQVVLHTQSLSQPLSCLLFDDTHNVVIGAAQTTILVWHAIVCCFTNTAKSGFLPIPMCFQSYLNSIQQVYADGRPIMSMCVRCDLLFCAGKSDWLSVWCFKVLPIFDMIFIAIVLLRYTLNKGKKVELLDKIFSKHTDVIHALTSMDPQTLCSGSYDQTIGIWSSDPLVQVNPLNLSVDVLVHKKTWSGWKDCQWKSNQDEVIIEVNATMIDLLV